MKHKRLLQFFWLMFISVVIYNCSPQKKQTTKIKTPPSKPVIKSVPTQAKVEDNFRVDLPTIKREFRGAWIASVANINWPSKTTLTSDQQKAEAVQMLDMLQHNNFNAVILQVRPSGDALYKSDNEPWSYFLTGEIGKAPFPYYDPLEFWISEAHKRGIELHIWLNPYRAHHSNGGKVTSASLANKFSDVTYRLRNGMYWFDPASQVIQDHLSKVVLDLVKRYDIDGVHFDDYFYPYASYNGGADFPDSKTWSAYKNAGGNLSRADWRRDNVNRFVERIYRDIKTEKNEVKFGISPFGIWKPDYPTGIKGSSQYDELYADAKLWLNKGWVDYFAPQLYWPINSTGQSFPKLLEWWKSENHFNRHLWPGLNTVEIKSSDRPNEITNQIEVSRQILKDDNGVIHWSIAGLTKNGTMQTTLKTRVYQDKVLIPRSPWLKPDKALSQPKLNLKSNGSHLSASWTLPNQEEAFQWVLFTKYGDEWQTQILNSNIKNLDIIKFYNGTKLNTLAIKAIDRLGNETDYRAEKVK
ncbi:glycoside hydrolase family 10 protein [Epilithonimonas tenax]|uniref:glycoside hydrolase family 10 protein n=1 Tax=Epilithonimonas tenax TaxID=191577 RepID=UPI000552F481|nr:family 10 glycosylhydrolase [Epilithonimonas tenax]